MPIDTARPRTGRTVRLPHWRQGFGTKLQSAPPRHSIALAHRPAPTRRAPRKRSSARGNACLRHLACRTGSDRLPRRQKTIKALPFQPAEPSIGLLAAASGNHHPETTCAPLAKRFNRGWEAPFLRPRSKRLGIGAFRERSDLDIEPAATLSRRPRTARPASIPRVRVSRRTHDRQANACGA